VVNNAGILVPIAPIADGDPKLWERNMAVNVLGPLMLTQAALPHLRQRSGRVINVSCGAAISVIPGWAAYSAATAALDHLTRVLAKEEPSITTVAFRPGVVDTAMQATIRSDGARGMPEEAHARFVRYHEEDGLLPPEVPGCALAVLALYAPHQWTGSFLAWNHEDLRSLVRQFACGPGGHSQS
jgi:NAD(P)-dependent dehydrogenase (short-subunit alcohol dehydrogenase family)